MARLEVGQNVHALLVSCPCILRESLLREGGWITRQTNSDMSLMRRANNLILISSYWACNGLRYTRVVVVDNPTISKQDSMPNRGVSLAKEKGQGAKGK